ncbi:hypothetical protein J0J70_12185 [Turicibacter bilis]|uniref:O-antigen ligase-related domain-containing protein n=1 Tax=Turicibacter bilis TaxID=2735723 RepID=A0A9Q9CR00_9FIRM|nr:O-antigen ligase family protein [Turicibacter bilis]MBS3198664.1 hypothetical protein [Turicibacter bilis]UUF08317.1 hypothetical protein J0J70_12185 [Turicibacter bilis]
MKKIFSFLILFVFIYSKFFYISIFNLGGFNFTLSDLSIGVMYISIAFDKRLFNKDNKKILLFYNSIFLLSLLMLFTSSLGALLINNNVLNGIMTFLKMWMLSIYIPLFIYLKFNKKDIKYFIYMIMILSILFIFDYSKVLQQENFSENMRFYGEHSNPNGWGAYFSCIIIMLIHIKQKSLTFKILKIITFLICLIFIMYAGSRTAMFSILIVLFLILLNTKLSLDYLKLIKYLFISICVIACIPFAIKFIEIAFPHTYFRLERALVDQGILGDESVVTRFQSQIFFLTAISNYPENVIFGVGIGGSNLTRLSSLNFGTFQTSDNQYTEIFLWSGLIGFLIFSCILFKIYTRINMKIKQNIPITNAAKYVFIYMFLCGFTMYGFTESMISSNLFILLGFVELERKFIMLQ